MNSKAPDRAVFGANLQTGEDALIAKAKAEEAGLRKSADIYNGPVVVIVGPTGSGKTGVGIELAQQLSGEVISADSRAIYKGMDLGTAKPSPMEQQGVPHYGIDLVEPGERFTVADWQAYAEQIICSICQRGHVPIVVGGTGLYVDALVFHYQFDQAVQKSCSDRQKMDPNYRIFGIKWEIAELRARLEQRLNKLFVQELYAETAYLVSKYGWGQDFAQAWEKIIAYRETLPPGNLYGLPRGVLKATGYASQPMKSNIYLYAWGYLTGKCTLAEAKYLNLLDDYHLAKRQMTWFKRNDKILWLPLDKIVPSVLKCIQDG